jgi:hypothetical protein
MKRTSAKNFSLLLKKISREIESLSDLELQELADSPDPLIFWRPTGVHNEKASSKPSEVDTAFIIQALKDMRVRDEGAKYLADVASTKNQLSTVAKALDLPVGKRNSHEEIAAKIIEATIGFRIRSAAIRGGYDEVKQERPPVPSEPYESTAEKQDEADGEANDEKQKDADIPTKSEKQGRIE